MIELMVCFETGYEEAHMWKTTHYADLMEQIVDSGFDEELVYSSNSYSNEQRSSGERCSTVPHKQPSKAHTKYG